MKLSRRAVLRGLGATVALPFLESVGSAAAPVNRLAYLYFPNGIPRGTWFPERTAADGRILKLYEWMKPQKPEHQKLLPLAPSVCRCWRTERSSLVVKIASPLAI